MLNVFKNNTIFPDYIKLNINKEFISKLNELVSLYKENLSDAVIYSIIEQKPIKSDRRKSLKKSFESDKIKELIDKNICPLIYSLLKTEYPNVMYNVEIGEQKFDYIKYENGGYFEPHRDWVRVTNSQFNQYTLLLGLTDDKYNYYNGDTILWIPVNNLNQYDYKILTESTEPNEFFKAVSQKYNLPFSFDLTKELLETNKSSQKCIPTRINAFSSGNGLMFQSSFIHSGEKFNSHHSCKELFSITINVTGVEVINELTDKTKDDELDKYLIPKEKSSMITSWLSDTSNKFILYDEFENWMCFDDCKFIKEHNLYPFQIIVSSGTYNNKKFSDKYLRFGNIDSDIIDLIVIDNKVNLLEKISQNLNEIYNLTKNKLNKRGRETFINSIVKKTDEDKHLISNLDNMCFILNDLDADTKYKIKYNLSNYLDNFTYSNNSKVTRFEEILNTWEESGCNDSGDEYDEITYLTCQIDIKFGFFKLV